MSDDPATWASTSELSGDNEVDEERRKLNEEYKRYLEDVRTVLSTPAGERFVCVLLERLGTFDPCWTDKNARLARAVVLRDFGQDLLDDFALASSGVHDRIQHLMRVRRKVGADFLNL